MPAPAATDAAHFATRREERAAVGERRDFSVKLASAKELDREILGWLAASRDLSSGSPVLRAPHRRRGRATPAIPGAALTSPEQPRQVLTPREFRT